MKLRKALFFRAAVIKTAFAGLVGLLLPGMSAAALAVTVSASPTTCINDASIGTQPWSTLTGPFAGDNVLAPVSVFNCELS